MSQTELEQSQSEKNTLQARGYEIMKKLGEGSFARVFLAEYKPNNEPDTNIKLACKVVDTSNAPRDIVQKFFPRELAILVKIDHPHVVQVHSIFQRRSKYFIFMRFAENGDLLQYIMKHGPVSERQARVWMRQLALGLQYLHEMEIAHRDIKCENVLLTENLNVKLADFGFARYVTDIRGRRVMSDTFCGSLLYAAPEILRGIPYHPKIADVWSLGVILYIVLNKAMPFDETNLARLYELQVSRRWKFRGKIVDELSENVKKLVTNLLEPDTTKRLKTEQIINSDWVTMDPRLTELSPKEQTALDYAIDEGKKLITEQKSPKKNKIIHKVDQPEQETEVYNYDSQVESVKIIKEVNKTPIAPSSIINDNSFKKVGSITTET